MEYDRESIYACGFQVYMGIKIRISPGVPIPREETELLGFTALRMLDRVPSPRIIDLCTGSGNISCALAVKVHDALFWVVDISPDSIVQARLNVDQLSLKDRVFVEQSDLFTSLHGLSLYNMIDLVVANPPYIPSWRLDRESKRLLEREPREAFDGGPYGLGIIQRIINDSAPFLRENRPLCFEFGAGQHGMVERLLERSGLYHSIQMVSDTAGTPRVAVAFKK